MYFSQHSKAVLLLVEIFAGGQNFRPAVVSRNAERKPNGLDLGMLLQKAFDSIFWWC